MLGTLTLDAARDLALSLGIKDEATTSRFEAIVRRNVMKVLRGWSGEPNASLPSNRSQTMTNNDSQASSEASSSLLTDSSSEFISTNGSSLYSRDETASQAEAGSNHVQQPQPHANASFLEDSRAPQAHL